MVGRRLVILFGSVWGLCDVVWHVWFRHWFGVTLLVLGLWMADPFPRWRDRYLYLYLYSLLYIQNKPLIDDKNVFIDRYLYI